MGIQVLPDNMGGPFGRIGRGLGKGLAESIPKEVERQRLSTGLKQFAENSQGLSPLQQLAEVSSIAGVTPQMIQSFGDLAKQQTQSNALSNRTKQEFPKRNTSIPKEPKQGTPSTTTTTPTDYAINPYIPKNYDQILDRGSELYNQDKGFYKNDPNLAIQAAVQEDAQNSAISNAQRDKRKSQQDVLNKVQSDLSDYKKRANVKVPDNVYSPIENEAIRQVRDGEKTEDVAARDARDELDKISRQYQSIEDLGNWTLPTKSPSAIKSSQENLRQQFKKRDDLENLADSFVGKNGHSYPVAYHQAFKMSDYKESNNFLSKLPNLNKENIPERLHHGFIPEDVARKRTEEIAPELAKAMGKEASPLGIGVELKSKGYDPQAWIDYLVANQRKLDLSERQGRELNKPLTWVPNLNDLWLLYFSGLEKLVEQ